MHSLKRRVRCWHFLRLLCCADKENRKRLLPAVPASRLVDPSTAELHPRLLEAFTTAVEEVVEQLESTYIAEEFSGDAEKEASGGLTAGGERGAGEGGLPAGRRARASVRERSPERVACLQGRRTRALMRKGVKEGCAGEGAKGGARRRPSQGGRRGTLAAGRRWHNEDFFLLVFEVGSDGEGKSEPKVGTGGGYARVGDKNIMFLAEKLPKLRFL
jgi:hypothetical protein